MQEDAELALVERHLGLMPVNETAEAERHIAAIGERIAAQVDLDRLLAISHTDVALTAACATAAQQRGAGAHRRLPAMPLSASTTPTTSMHWLRPAREPFSSIP